nr:MAG TPA: hypothetical protein [Caudoviricetes sp.]
MLPACCILLSAICSTPFFCKFRRCSPLRWRI